MEAKGLNWKGFSTDVSKGKGVGPVIAVTDGSMSEEDEPSYNEDGNGENSSGGKCKNEWPWKRTKWTDNVVRLLIAVVSCVGDDGSHVSPQQCEDKFNDLNKRYKKLNDILGRETSCVVENPSVMDSMPHLLRKAKEDVKKILSSKHLFYQEMCAYHNGQSIPNCQDLDIQGCILPERCLKDNNRYEEEEDDNEDDYEMDNEDDNNAICGERIPELNERKKASVEEGHYGSQCAGHDSSSWRWKDFKTLQGHHRCERIGSRGGCCNFMRNE
ncbi:ADP/ATP carrier 2 isoform 1 [Hibiscus syriacus]|uniref:ADP/ATP carrier 2 isoform 1 n=1 Tax=Hibiscus syriacus TaxID=106335 RepID=A0A6A2X279_HIBSY|nr:ADP/ATP carrier 2 isoform 1 [Hibiscus syriacus]